MRGEYRMRQMGLCFEKVLWWSSFIVTGSVENPHLDPGDVLHRWNRDTSKTLVELFPRCRHRAGIVLPN